MKCTEYKDKQVLIASIIDPDNFVLWAAYVEARMSEDKKSFDEAMKMGDYHFAKSVDLALSKADLILKLLER